MKKEDLIKLTESLSSAGFQILSFKENFYKRLPGRHDPITVDLNIVPLPKQQDYLYTPK